MKKIKGLLLLSAAGLTAGPVENLKPGEWYAVPNSHMDAVAEPGSHIGNISCVMSCWAGGAFDTKRNRLYVTGGGHNGYSGTEIYAFDVDSLKWIRLDNSVPLGTGPGGECPADPDATPCATHTYDGVEYLPAPVDRFIEVSFPLNMTAFLYNPQTFVWQKKSQYPCNDPNFYYDANPTGALSAYDPGRGLYWWRSSYMGDLAYYNPAADKWRCYGKGKWVGYYQNMAMDPKRKKLVSTGDGYTAVWDIADTSVANLDLDSLKTTGDIAIESANNPGFDYDPVSDRFIAWRTGADVYSLNLDTKVWTRIAPAATNTVIPTAPNMNGTYGRFRYMPAKNAYILVNNTNENVFIYRLAGGSTAGESAPATVAGLKVYPNPARVGETIHFTGLPAFDVFNVAGRRIFSSGKTGAKWLTSRTAPGIYFVQGRDGEKWVTKKILIQH